MRICCAVLIALHAFASTGCTTRPAGVPEAPAADPAKLPAPPAVDLSSPESAVRSYWALRDWRNITVQQNRPVDPAETVYVRAMAALTAGETRKFYESLPEQTSALRREKYERTIVSTTLESPERAVVLTNIRNVSPIPRGAKPSPLEAQVRKKGEGYKYVLVREAGQWRVSEVWSQPLGLLPARRMHGSGGPPYPGFVPPQ